jgi:hypothetical protein
MEEEKYQKKVMIINKISQHMEKINELSVELEEEGLDNSKHYSKLTKGIGFISFFTTNERKFMKKMRRDFYEKINDKK